MECIINSDYDKAILILERLEEKKPGIFLKLNCDGSLKNSCCISGELMKDHKVFIAIESLRLYH